MIRNRSKFKKLKLWIWKNGFDLPTYEVLCLEAFVRDAGVSTKPEQHGGTR